MLTPEELEYYRSQIASEPANANGDFPDGKDRYDPTVFNRYVTSSKITPEQARQIYLDPRTYAEIKKAMGLDISIQAICLIKTGKNWRHVTGHLDPPELSRRLTKEEVLQIFYSEGSNVAIAKQFNISKHTVRAIKARFIHKDITKRPS